MVDADVGELADRAHVRRRRRLADLRARASRVDVQLGEDGGVGVAGERLRVGRANARSASTQAASAATMPASAPVSMLSPEIVIRSATESAAMPSPTYSMTR
jgi:hypothetical protein